MLYQLMDSFCAFYTPPLGKHPCIARTLTKMKISDTNNIQICINSCTTIHVRIFKSFFGNQIQQIKYAIVT